MIWNLKCILLILLIFIRTNHIYQVINRHMQLPNDQLKQLELVEHLAVEMQHSDAGPLHAGPRCQAEVQTVLKRTFADRHTSSEFRATDGRVSVLPVQHRVPSACL